MAKIVIENYPATDPRQDLLDYVFKNIKKCEYDFDHVVGISRKNKIITSETAYNYYYPDDLKIMQQRIYEKTFVAIKDLPTDELYKVGICFSDKTKHDKLFKLYSLVKMKEIEEKLNKITERMDTFESNIGIAEDLKSVINDFTNMTKN